MAKTEIKMMHSALFDRGIIGSGHTNSIGADFLLGREQSQLVSLYGLIGPVFDAQLSLICVLMTDDTLHMPGGF